MNYYVEFFKTWGNMKELYPLIKIVSKVFRKEKVYNTHEELANAFFTENLTNGDVVIIEGYLSKFQHCYMPKTNSHYVYQSISGPKDFDPNNPPNQYIKNEFDHVLKVQKQYGFRYVPNLMGVEGLEEIHTSIKKPILPSTVVPRIISGDNNFIQPAFLYPSNSSGMDVKMISMDNEFLAEKNSLGIPIIIKNSAFIESYKETHVRLIGRITELPRDIFFETSNINRDLKLKLSEYYFNPSKFYNKGFVIEVEHIESVENKFVIDDRTVRIYVEGHFECYMSKINDISILYRYSNELLDYYKNELNLEVAITNLPKLEISAINLGNVFITFRNPNFIGFYTDITLPNNFEDGLKEFYSVINHTVDYFREVLKSKVGEEVKFQVDSMFDFDYSNMFEDDIVLNSKSIQEYLADKVNRDIKKWLLGK